MITFFCKVIRNGVKSEIPVSELVPGDIVYLQTGDRVPADLRLIHLNDFLVNESILTGESYPVKKCVEKIESAPAIAEQKNMAFMGSSVVSGEGIGVVVATGGDTYFGKTAALLKEVEEECTFQKNIRNFSEILLKIILISIFFVFLINALLGK